MDAFTIDLDKNTPEEAKLLFEKIRQDVGWTKEDVVNHLMKNKNENS